VTARNAVGFGSKLLVTRGRAAMSEWEALTALAEESRTLSAVLLELDLVEFQRPTNCPPWDLKEHCCI
jgi:hypothetical protein